MTEIFDHAAEDKYAHVNTGDLFPKKETIDDVRKRLAHCFKWLDKAVDLIKTKDPHEVDLAIWVNEKQTVACPAAWCGLNPEFQAETFILKIPSSYQPPPAQMMPTYIVRNQEMIGAAAISEMFELYSPTNGSLEWYHVFGWVGESMYDLMLEDEDDREVFIQRVGLYKKDIEFSFHEKFGESLLTKE